MGIDEAIDRFALAVQRAGVAPVRPPADTAVLAEVERRIAPLVLPAEARRLWERVDPRSLRLEIHPSLCDPAFSLEVWQRHNDENPGTVPRPLFPLCYESHNFLFVELDDADGIGGGALFEWAYGGDLFKLRAYRVADWLESLAQLIEEGEPSPGGGSGPLLDWDRYIRIVSDRLEHSPRHPVYGAPRPHPRYSHIGYSVTFEEDILAWPERWRRLSGVINEDRAPRGATHTIAELMRAAERAAEQEPGVGLVRATIAGAVVALGGSRTGWEATVDDGTGQLRVWCPARVTTFGPRIRDHFEFDVVLSWDAQAQRAARHREAMKTSPIEDDRIAARFIGLWGPLSDAATAEAIRRLPAPDEEQGLR